MQFARIAPVEDLTDVCASTPVSDDHQVLLQKLQRVLPGLQFEHVLTRSGWYRPAGLIDANGERISEQVREWIQQVADDDVERLYADYAEKGYIVTRYAGQTHYFVAATGDRAQDYVQLEVEELQEYPYHALFDSSQELPEDLEELIDPLAFEKLDGEPLGAPRYVFRRVTPVAEFVRDMVAFAQDKADRDSTNVQRFMLDWERSSARESGPFCHHWVLSMRHYIDGWGEPCLQAMPVSTREGDVATLEITDEDRGSRLARRIHAFDRTMGYPMAWYFFMLSHRQVPYQLADAIHRDQMGAYEYLPPRDLKILRDWCASPYSI